MLTCICTSSSNTRQRRQRPPLTLIHQSSLKVYTSRHHNALQMHLEQNREFVENQWDQGLRFG
jgi:hypothetical protein